MDAVINVTNLFISALLDFALDNPAFSIPAFLFLIFASIWRQTGRFPVVGYIVRLLYLPINFVFLVLWLASSLLLAVSRLLRFSQSFSGVLLFVLILLTLKDIDYFFTIPAFFLLLVFRADTEALREKITYYPRARRRPPPKQKPARPLPAPKAAPLPNKPQPAPAAPPIVQVAASVGAAPYKFNQLIGELPPHLRELVGGAAPAEPEAEAEATGCRKVPLLKLVLRSLLLLPLGLLLLLAKPFRKQKQPGQETQPLTSEANSNE